VGQIVGQIIGSIILSLTSEYKIFQIIYLCSCVTISIICAITIGLTVSPENVPIIPLYISVIIFFFSFLFLVIPYKLNFLLI
jgi:hypothetical protein